MTAEIAILNNSGIALAADSAVTISGQKVYNTANKLFTLSKTEPVGIMVYNAASVWNTPWETIIKQFRSTLGDTSYNTLKEFADSFWEFILTNEIVISSRTRQDFTQSMAWNYFNLIFQEIKKKVGREIDTSTDTSLEETIPHAIEAINASEILIDNADYADGYNDENSVALIEPIKDTIIQQAQRRLGRIYGLLETHTQEQLISNAAKVYVKNFSILNSSGIVIAGFGRNEMFPKISSYILEAVYEHGIKKTFLAGKSNVHYDDFRTSIVPFAQDEMVWTFLGGIDPRIQNFAGLLLQHIFEKYPNKLDSLHPTVEQSTIDQLKQILTEGGETLLKEFSEKIENYKSTNNTNPILQMVGSLPKDELAAMAESLVNLTVFKRKVTGAIETVGGPIDVAVISKGDGFIWVKRKHYFKPELNPNFFCNYFNSEH